MASEVLRSPSCLDSLSSRHSFTPPKRKFNDTQSISIGNSIGDDQLKPDTSFVANSKSTNNRTSHCFSSDMRQVWLRYFSVPDLSTDADNRNFNRPCPACKRSINLNFKENGRDDDKAFELQRIIPWGCGADRDVDNWNLVPLCSHYGKQASKRDDCDSDNDNDDNSLWGCSERLEREGGVHAFDWMLKNYPHRLQEMCMRLQLAHGESFGMPAGETLCLRFVRDVYGEGRPRICDMNGVAFDSNSHGTSAAKSVDPATRWEEWKMKKVGFKCDILDIAECFMEMTDREMIRVVEMKTKLATPRIKKRIAGMSSSARQTVKLVNRSPIKCKQKLFASECGNEPRPPDSDDDSDYRSADSDDESCSEDECQPSPNKRPRID